MIHLSGIIVSLVVAFVVAFVIVVVIFVLSFHRYLQFGPYIIYHFYSLKTKFHNVV